MQVATMIFILFTLLGFALANISLAEEDLLDQLLQGSRDQQRLAAIKAREASRCPRGQRFSTCKTSCPVTCLNYQNPPKVCVPDRCVMGCECLPGLVYSWHDRCVHSSVCSMIMKEYSRRK